MTLIIGYYVSFYSSYKMDISLYYFKNVNVETGKNFPVSDLG